MFTSFQVAEANALLMAYYKLCLRFESTVWELMKVGFTAHEAGLLCKHIDAGHEPPFSKRDVIDALGYGDTND